MKRDNEPELFADEPTGNGFVMIDRRALQKVLLDLSDPARRVLLALCTFADGAGHCFPSRNAIAERAGIRPAHKVSYATAELVTAGYLEINQTGRTLCNSYTLRKVMYLQRVHHSESDVPLQGTPLPSDVPLQGTGDVPSEGTSIIERESFNERGDRDAKNVSRPRTKSKETNKSEKPSSPAIECLQHFAELHRHHRGTAYVPNHAADGAHLKRLLQVLGPDEIRMRMTQYFIRRDPWNEDHGYTVTNFCSVINGLAGNQAAAPARTYL